MVIRISTNSSPSLLNFSFKTSKSQLKLDSARRWSSTHPPGTAIYPSLPCKSISKRPPEMQVDHLVVGAGVVGLAIAAQLASRWPEKTTYVVERNERAGEETSSRNSEVIHAGFHYPPQSLKTQFCLRGRELLYSRCSEWNISHSQIGKLTVGDSTSYEKLLALEKHSNSLGPLSPSIKLLSEKEAKELEPDLGSNIKHALMSYRTGIVSSHELIESLEREILDSGDNSELVYGTKVVRVDPNLPNITGNGNGNGKRGVDLSQEGWIVQTKTEGSQNENENENETDSILARVLINASGLNAPLMLNSLINQEIFNKDSKEEKIGMYYSKGNYVTYRGDGTKNVKRLIYPMPFGEKKEGGNHSFQGLGTHLTLDLDGNVKFGPDTEWLSPLSNHSIQSSNQIDYWKKNLSVSDSILEKMESSIQLYLPKVSISGLSPDYSGIRPKLIGPSSKEFKDFEILFHTSRDLKSQKLFQKAFPNGFSWGSKDSKGIERLEIKEGGKETGLEENLKGKVVSPMINLLGIESPGLTSSLAIGESLAELIGRTVWGNQGRLNNRRKSNSGGNKMRDEGGEIDGWA